MLRLSIGPIDITLLKNYLEPKDISQQYSFDVDHIFLEYKGVQEPFVVEIDSLTVRNENHHPFFQIPTLTLSLDYSALLKGKIRLRSLHLQGPQVVLDIQNSSIKLEEVQHTEEYISAGILGAFFGIGPEETQTEMRKVLKHLDELFLENGSLKIIRDGEEILSIPKFNISLKPSDSSNISYSFKVEAEEISCFFPELDKRIFEIPMLAIQGEVNPDLEKTEFTVLPFMWQGATGKMEGTAFVRDASLAEVKLTMTSSPIPLANFPDVWPEGLATTTREWIIHNLSKGGIDGIQLNLELEIPLISSNEDIGIKLKNLKGRFNLKDIMVDYITGLPLAEVVSGIARFNMDQFDIEILKGHLQDIQVLEGMIHFFDLSTDVEKAKIDLKLEGSLSNILAVIDHPPLHYAQKLGINPLDFQGDAYVHLALTFPLLSKLELDQIDVLTKATLQHVSYIHALPREDHKNLEITAGNFDLVVDKNYLKLQGEAFLEGSKSFLSWKENFKKESTFSREMICFGRFPIKTFVSFGLPIEEFAQGDVNLKLVMHEKNKNHTSVKIYGDIKEAELNFPMIGAHKKMGEAGFVSFVWDMPPNHPWTLSKIRLQSPLIYLAGDIVLNQETHEISTVDLSSLKVLKTDISMHLSKISQDMYDLKIQGKSLDASWFFKDRKTDNSQEVEEEHKSDFKLNLSLDRLWTRGEEFITSLRLLLKREKDRYTRVECNGNLKNGDKLTVTFRHRNQSPGILFFLKAHNAGDFLRLFDVYGDLKSGVLTIEGKRESDDPQSFLEGQISLEEFRLMKAPVLAKILSLASLGGIADLLGGKGLYFDKAIFTFKANENLVEIIKGLAESSATGITTAGVIDRRHKTLSLKGNVIPLYMVNSLIGKIPLLGNLLTGGEDKGFLAATYEVKGSYDDPKISVNPLSMLTPGFIRELF